MVQLTPMAEFVLAETMKAGGVEEGQALRLRSEEGQYSLHMDTPRESDRVIYKDELALLIVEPEADLSLGNAVIDVEEVDNQPRLVLRRPEAQG